MTDAAMKIGAIAPWFGGKRTMAADIVRELGKHTQYFEPFCGSCAVLLAKPAARMEYINDLNGDLVNLIRCMTHAALGPALYRKLRRMLMAETLFRESAARWKKRGHAAAPDEPDLDRAVDYFYTSWVGRNGVVGTQSFNQGFAARFTGRGGHAGTRWLSSVDSIPAWRRRMRGVVALNRDAFELLERIEDEPTTAIYCDPPYLVKGARYVHDFEDVDHARLAAALARFRRARVVVSYYDDPRLEDLYPAGRWTTVHLTQRKSLMSGNGRAGEASGAAAAPEVLIVNGHSLGGPGLFGQPHQQSLIFGRIAKLRQPRP